MNEDLISPFAPLPVDHCAEKFWGMFPTVWNWRRLDFSFGSCWPNGSWFFQFDCPMVEQGEWG